MMLGLYLHTLLQILSITNEVIFIEFLNSLPQAVLPHKAD